MDGDLGRLERDLESIRLDMRALEREVHRLDVEGTRVTQYRISNLEHAQEEFREDQKASRTMMRSALISAALAIAVNLIVAAVLFVVLGSR